jgi:hypothetical protein
MADVHPSFYGPILPQPAGAPEAFTFEELRQIRARRLAADRLREAEGAWPAQRRFRTIYPGPQTSDASRVA